MTDSNNMSSKPILNYSVNTNNNLFATPSSVTTDDIEVTAVDSKGNVKRDLQVWTDDDREWLQQIKPDLQKYLASVRENIIAGKPCPEGINYGCMIGRWPLENWSLGDVCSLAVLMWAEENIVYNMNVDSKTFATYKKKHKNIKKAEGIQMDEGPQKGTIASDKVFAKGVNWLPLWAQLGVIPPSQNVRPTS